MHIISSYYFKNLHAQQVQQLRSALNHYAQQHNIRGLCLIGPEGFNGTLSVPEQHTTACQNTITQLLQAPDMEFKTAHHPHHPFDSFKIKIKNEIITYTKTQKNKVQTTSTKATTHKSTTQTAEAQKSLQNQATSSLTPRKNFYKHLSPAQWHKAIQKKDAVVLDVRNHYEYHLGHFKKAQHFNIDEFSQISSLLPRASCAGVSDHFGGLGPDAPSHRRPRPSGFGHRSDPPPQHKMSAAKTLPSTEKKNKAVLLYCTGGIRCEKVLLDLEARGFNNVHQLSGGILNYLDYIKNNVPTDTPPHNTHTADASPPSTEPENNSLWQGECFVFDYRVAVDSQLQASKRYRICPHCGDPGDQHIQCAKCQAQCCVCKSCYQHSPHKRTCSKNCAWIFNSSIQTC